MATAGAGAGAMAWAVAVGVLECACSWYGGRRDLNSSPPRRSSELWSGGGRRRVEALEGSGEAAPSQKPAAAVTKLYVGDLPDDATPGVARAGH